jgi:hypothetical protein
MTSYNFITKIFNYFSHHPNKNNMSYLRHMVRSLNMSLKMGLGSFYLFVHSICPFLFQNNGSQMIISLYKEYNLDKDDKDDKDK